MLDFLKQVDISDDIICQLNNRYDDAMKLNINANAENCLGIIIYMKKVGIKDIDELLLNKPDWFLKTSRDFIELCMTDQSLINRINDNYEDVSI